MPTIVSTSFADIILKVKDRLVTELSLVTQQVKIVARDRQRVPAWTGDRDILLRVLNFQHRTDIYQAAGRTCIRYKRWFDVICRQRNYLDEQQEDISFLTDEVNGLGLIRLEESAALALIGYQPTDSEGNHLTVEELRVSDGDVPYRDDYATEWGGSLQRFEAEHFLLLGGNYTGF